MNKIVLFSLSILLLLSCSPALENTNTSAKKTTTGLEATQTLWETYQKTQILEFGDKYIVEGDIVVNDLQEVRDLFDSYYPASRDVPASRSTVWMDPATGDIDYNVFWTAAEKKNIIYQISGFPEGEGFNSKGFISISMTMAADDWECADVDFINIESIDPALNPEPVFVIRPATAEEESAGFTILSFYPHKVYTSGEIGATREIIISERFFERHYYEMAYFIKHATGHSLGLRNEHIWSNGIQIEELYGSQTNAVLVGSQDLASVMYDLDRPEYTGNCHPTDTDRAALKVIYGEAPSYAPYRRVTLVQTGDGQGKMAGGQEIPAVLEQFPRGMYCIFGVETEPDSLLGSITCTSGTVELYKFSQDHNSGVYIYFMCPTSDDSIITFNIRKRQTRSVQIYSNAPIPTKTITVAEGTTSRIKVPEFYYSPSNPMLIYRFSQWRVINESGTANITLGDPHRCSTTITVVGGDGTLRAEYYMTVRVQ